MYIYMYICIYVYMYIHTYICIYIYTCMNYISHAVPCGMNAYDICSSWRLSRLEMLKMHCGVCNIGCHCKGV